MPEPDAVAAAAPGRGPPAVAPGRSEVRRLHLSELEQVRHRRLGQEWVPHWHDEWSFGAIVAGECRCSVAGRPFVARAGDLVSIAPGVVHTGALAASARGGPVLVTMLYVPAAWLGRAGLAPPPGSGRVRAPALARAARDLASPEAARAWLARAVPALAAALARAPSARRDPLPSASVRALLARVQAAVAGGERTVLGLARRCGVSRERLHRVLRRWIGMSPGGYLRAVRLHRARLLVLDGVPAAAVAADCGFADQAHFTRWFRRTFGYTPGDLVQAAAAGRAAPRRDAPRRRARAPR